MRDRKKSYWWYAALIWLWIIPSACSDKPPQQEKGTEKEVVLTIPNYPLQSEEDLDVLLEEIGDARIVLLGEASHGTSEYYTWRAAITKRLIAEKGFDFVAVEGEWADSYRVNEFIRGGPRDSAEAVALLRNFNRWPTWMWANYEVASFVSWLNAYNQAVPEPAEVGFYGLDVYCIWESMTELMPYLAGNPALMKMGQEVHECFQPYSADAQQYALAVANADANCRAEIRRLWKAVQKLSKAEGEGATQSEAQFVAEQNALVALNGERYFRTMVTSSVESWNIRDRHMALTLERLLEFHGPESKAIIWEHNTHVGDARYTNMVEAGEVNVGQLVRQEYGKENVFLVGFGSYSGTVIAAGSWGAPMRTIPVPPAAEGSWEQILHLLGPTNKIILSKDIRNENFLKRPIGHRAIGVVYNPELEHLGNYVPSVIPKRYDAFIFIDTTQALHPIETITVSKEPPDLYPWGT
ncbi:erythromycin esterase-like protein [Pontibacter ummariensis]|uniref:Erythromycin esterase homolog n=1 Tax=Pontibacter ummariensis TaxID=1610492 RepID=A0A239I1Z3_9BACT|nr:erythromycin esterase family protein [Pontibacter ummariensis]PRY10179.1 erythromycin esterase-like protein [Pontibacter ummariensis]SNS87539.1 Erythromycin esterase homolog [Pontibacter ummariensis]